MKELGVHNKKLNAMKECGSELVVAMQRYSDQILCKMFAAKATIL